MKKIGELLRANFRALWRRETLLLCVVLGVLAAASSFLSLIPPEASMDEVSFAQQAVTVRDIVNHPVNAPYKIVSKLMTEVAPSVRTIRVLSFSFYIAACISMFYMLKHWHNRETALLTTIAFGSNAVLLAIARLGLPIITIISFFIFAGMLLWQLHSISNKAVPMLILVSLAALLYVPGALWFFAVVAIVYWNRFKPLFKNVKRPALLVGAFLAVLIASPLLYGFIIDVDNLKEWLLLPSQLDWSTVPRAILRVPSAFVYRMPELPLVNIARLPIFDLATGIFFLIGAQAYIRKIKLDRTRVMIGAAIVAVILGALGQVLLSVLMLLPFAYSVIAAGIEYLLDEWYRVFPRNPVARSFGVLMITFTVLFSTYYQLTRFFVVWPQTPETRSTYNQSRIIQR